MHSFLVGAGEKKDSRPYGRLFGCVFLVDSVKDRIKREFRGLRAAPQGNGAHVLGPWPNKSATARRKMPRRDIFSIHKV